MGCGDLQRCKRRVRQHPRLKRRVFLGPRAPQIALHHLGQSVTAIPALDRDDDCHALLDVEDVLVGRALGGDLLLLGVSMQIQHPDPIKGLQKVPAHTPEGRVVEIAVVGDEP